MGGRTWGNVKCDKEFYVSGTGTVGSVKSWTVSIPRRSKAVGIITVIPIQYGDYARALHLVLRIQFVGDVSLLAEVT